MLGPRCPDEGRPAGCRDVAVPSLHAGTEEARSICSLSRSPTSACQQSILGVQEGMHTLISADGSEAGKVAISEVTHCSSLVCHGFGRALHRAHLSAWVPSCIPQDAASLISDNHGGKDQESVRIKLCAPQIFR